MVAIMWKDGFAFFRSMFSTRFTHSKNSLHLEMNTYSMHEKSQNYFGILIICRQNVVNQIDLIQYIIFNKIDLVFSWSHRFIVSLHSMEMFFVQHSSVICSLFERYSSDTYGHTYGHIHIFRIDSQYMKPGSTIVCTTNTLLIAPRVIVLLLFLYSFHLFPCNAMFLLRFDRWPWHLL